MARYYGVWIDLSNVLPGKYYLIRVSPKTGSDTYILEEYPGRKNVSGEECTEGWLGTTNNVDRYANGCVEVYGVPGHCKIKRITVEEMHASEEVGTD